MKRFLKLSFINKIIYLLNRIILFLENKNQYYMCKFIIRKIKLLELNFPETKFIYGLDEFENLNLISVDPIITYKSDKFIEFESDITFSIMDRSPNTEILFISSEEKHIKINKVLYKTNK